MDEYRCLSLGFAPACVKYRGSKGIYLYGMAYMHVVLISYNAPNRQALRRVTFTTISQPCRAGMRLSIVPGRVAVFRRLLGFAVMLSDWHVTMEQPIDGGRRKGEEAFGKRDVNCRIRLWWSVDGGVRGGGDAVEGTKWSGWMETTWWWQRRLWWWWRRKEEEEEEEEEEEDGEVRPLHHIGGDAVMFGVAVNQSITLLAQ
ncbi:hypothetical protein CIB48_g7324 [Xylaria polymorpha]|nr:hypothetical protein CIB48_g7324 [Xylaria polymorpha]